MDVHYAVTVTHNESIYENRRIDVIGFLEYSVFGILFNDSCELTMKFIRQRTEPTSNAQIRVIAPSSKKLRDI